MDTDGCQRFPFKYIGKRESMSLSAPQSRAARGMLDWSQTELAKRSNLSESTVRDFEKGRRVPSVNNLAAIQQAFEAAGLEFIPENGGGAGIRFRERKG